MADTKAYEELVDFIAKGSSPESVIEFQVSEATRERVSELIAREKAGELTEAELAELEHYMQLEHVMRLAKARARRYLKQSAGQCA